MGLTNVLQDGLPDAYRIQTFATTGTVLPGAEIIYLTGIAGNYTVTCPFSAVPRNRFLVIKDTSASGTDSKTVTFTGPGHASATSHNVVLDAAKEIIILFFDADGQGSLVENVGSVTVN
jgi:hypothetical protein